MRYGCIEFFSQHPKFPNMAGGTPKSSKSFHQFSIDTDGDLGIHHLKKPRR